MPTRHRRIQVTEDPELSAALRTAAPHLDRGLSLSRQVRHLAVLGAKSLEAGGGAVDESRRREGLERLARRFTGPEEDSGIDFDVLRDIHRRAWRVE